MGHITGYTPINFIIAITFFIILFIIFCMAWWQTERFQDRATLWIILGFGSIFAITNIFVYPLTAGDLFLYVARSLIMVQHHANPMVTPPDQFANTDPLMKLAKGFMTLPSPYGPLAILIQALPVAIGGRNLLASLLLTKLLFSLILIACAFFVYKTLSHTAPKFALSGALALAWNPFTLLEFSVNSHNDIAMMCLVVLAVFALVKERPVWAMTLLTASVLIKFATLVLIPLFFIYSIVHQPTWQKRVHYTISSSITCCALTICCFAPFWIGPETLQRFFAQVQEQRYSFDLLLHNFSSGKISLHQAQLIGWALFGACSFYALWLSSKNLSSLLKGCFITMFAVLALSATFIQPWYLIWPFVFAILIAQTEVWLAVFFLVCAGVLAEIVHAYLYPWAFHIPGTLATVNSTMYLAFFLPPMLLLVTSGFLVPTIPFRKVALLFALRQKEGQ